MASNEQHLKCYPCIEGRNCDKLHVKIRLRMMNPDWNQLKAFANGADRLAVGRRTQALARPSPPEPTGGRH